jgi:citrate synthase
VTSTSESEPANQLPKPEGLEGVVAASTALSHVYGEEGRLVYRGYDIHELAGKATFEEVAHLLWVGHLPKRAELADLQHTMQENRSLPAPVIDILRLLPKETAPMDALRTGLSALGAVDPGHFGGPPDALEAIALAARFPAILAAFYRRKATSISSSATNRMSAIGNR